MSINKTAWLFIPQSEQAICDYLQNLLPDDVLIQPALTANEIQTPCISVRNTSVRPYTQESAIVAHAETTTAITVRTAMDEEYTDAGRSNHNALVSAVMGCLMVIDETTKENALPAELNAVGSEVVEFSLAAWSGNTSGADDDNRHFVTRIEIETIIQPKQAEQTEIEEGE
jgi:hypothetical protein